ncbi:hypothetical protein GGX14DRAFT_593226 [Mycena pura]|uniref:RNI-like protein n=1 Tax=Mycena pura TaxID=153505 RepID=A0AAD6Y647_9AGAR|nr:hypothetical protein GGX14DRAFT_593226 [Mycena pura]
MSLHSPSLGPSSPSPSSSAVTILIPGKSILKRPPPAQASLFSRLSLSRFLPAGDKGQQDSGASGGSGIGAGNPGGKDGGKDESARVLRRAHFILPELAVVYPISSVAPPSTPGLRDEKRAIEVRERERRRRVVRANSVGNGSTDSASVLTVGSGEEAEWWAMDKVESFYRECCEGCQEPPDKGITAAFKNTPPTDPRTVDFSGVQLTFTSASILADVLSIEWGLRKAVFRECDLDELTLKPILHALLIPRSLSYLSVASNRRLKGNAWKLVGAYLSKAHTLQFLDLSQNPLDKKAIEWIIASLGEYTPNTTTSSTASILSSDSISIDSRERDEPNGHRSEVRYGLGYGLYESRDKEASAGKRGLVSLKLDDCSLRAGALETLSRAVRTSSLRNISLRHNRISPTGAVALALMIRDYPDVLGGPSPAPSSPTTAAHPAISFGASGPWNRSNSPLPSPVLAHAPVPFAAGGKVPPPPRHPAQTITAAQTTYTPYVPRRRQQGAQAGVSAVPPGRPVVASSMQGGVTARHDPSKDREAREREVPKEREKDGPSAALLDKVRALDALPRVGALRTLDLRGNDLRTGITYIAQVLKRNRTLKVLNLAENKLDVACLVSLAEALKYNSSLEMLDLSRNPCSGPGLEGIQSLRTAFTLNTALKRLFLSSTGMGSPGAIALAEFLPESASLLHLDLTENALGLAGVLALSKGLEANFVMRCLDLNIPPGDEECARLCRDILNACVRNTEEADAQRAGGSGILTPVEPGPGVNDRTDGRLPPSVSRRGNGRGVWGLIEESELAKSIRLDEEKKLEGDVAVRARACIAQLETMLASPPPLTSSPVPAPMVPPADVLRQARALTQELGEVVQATEDPTRMEELLDVNDALTTLIARMPPPGRPTLTLQGLGLKWPAGASLTSESAAMGNGDVTALHANGYAGEGPEDHMTTPRTDKGKARAIPEPEEPEKVLSPTLILGDDDDDDDSERLHISPVEEGEDVEIESPTNRSRSWVEEEGEVFRKGTVLLGPEEMDGEYAGEELRKELLEAMVERPPPRPLTDPFGIEISEAPPPPPLPQDPPVSPTSPVTDKAPPRPYIARSRSSSSSIMSVLSPTISSFTPGGGQIPEGQASPRTPSAPSPLGNGVRPYLPRSPSSSTILDDR